MAKFKHQIIINTRIKDSKGKTLPVEISGDAYCYLIKYQNTYIGQVLY
ncbi:MAG: hypothetical protein RCG15_02475 [Candidatus Rickettsia vulgarisii]